ncbi:MAG: 2-hydroxyacid dehydrogenase [Candidatus Puniceispirillaceae bacterium]
MSVLSDVPLIVAYYDDAADAARREAWQARLQPFLPGITLVPLASPEADSAMAALVWKPPHGRIASLPALRGIVSLGQGVDHILADDSVPETLPLVRLVDPDMAQAMGHWVSLAVLQKIRKAADYRILAQRREFRPLPQIAADTCRIAIYGVGAIGSEVARQLVALGFQVTGYVNHQRQDDFISYESGTDGLARCLSECDMHVCLMPLTDDNKGFFNRDTFAQMKVGAYFINAGRGSHVVEDDLLAAVTSGHLAGACLDVFVTEPLPDNHPFWDNPHIEIWPHVAAQTNPETASQQVAQALWAFHQGKEPANLVDRKKGY